MGALGRNPPGKSRTSMVKGLVEEGGDDAASSFKMYVCLAMSKELMIALLGLAPGAAAADAAIKAQLGALKSKARKVRMAHKLPMPRSMQVTTAATLHATERPHHSGAGCILGSILSFFWRKAVH